MSNIPTKYETKFPGCSNEPPWWPSSKPISYRLVPMSPAMSLRGPNLPILIATRGKNTLAYWSIVLQAWIMVLP